MSIGPEWTQPRGASPAVWFLAIRARTGADVFTMRLAEGLQRLGVRTEISWLPHHAEYQPFTVPVPNPPEWANIVHVNTWLHRRFVPLGLPLMATRHHCVHDPAFSKYKNWRQAVYHKLWIKPIEAWILSHANMVTAVSQYTADKTIEAFGVRDIRVIHNGVDTRVFRSVHDQGLHSPFRLLYVGSWSKRKGVDLLAPIMASLGEDFELRYTSDPASKHVNGSLPSNCHCIGKPDNSTLVALYQSSDALLFPTRLEGFGQVAAEALACGLPIITTNGSAMTEVVTDGGTGFLCRQDDIEDFVCAIVALSQCEEGWSRMSTNAAEAARNYFGIDAMVEKYLNAYEAIL